MRSETMIKRAAVVCCCMLMLAAYAGAAAAFEGRPAPDFQLPGLLEGRTQSLKDLKGRVVLLNIWASWCSGCREEMEDLMQVQEEYGPRGFSLVTVNIDNSSSKAVDFIKSLEDKTGKKTGFILLYDAEKSVSKAYRQRGMPTSYLIDREGIVKKIYPGSFTRSTLVGLRSAIEEALK